MYTLNENGYELYNKFMPEENMNQTIRDTINILFINDNHFNLLLPNNNENNNSNNNKFKIG